MPTLEQFILQEIGLTQEDEHTTFSNALRIMGAMDLPKALIKAKNAGWTIALKNSENEDLFEAIVDIALYGERGYNLMENTRTAICYLLRVLEFAVSLSEQERHVLYTQAHTYLQKTYPLLHVRHYKTPGMHDASLT